ncbi:MAG: Mu transposase C-terminal domain-containing protein [Rikenellaceae bacterium]|nr:Mu transposase C-terminal domain-containing protein [Rikenellaceae bacterium]
MKLNQQGQILISYMELVPAVWSINTYSTLRKRGKLTTDVRGGNGRHVSIYYDRLNDHYKRQILEVLGDRLARFCEEVGVELDVPTEPKAQRYTKPDYNSMNFKEQELCRAKYNIIKCYREFTELNAEEMSVMGAKREFVEMVRGGMLCTDSFHVVGTVSFKTLERWDKTLRDGGDVMDALGPQRAIKHGTTLSISQQKNLLGAWLKDTQPNYATAYRTACRLWRFNREPIHSLTTCRRFLMEWESKHRSEATFRRRGIKPLRDECLPYIEKDPNSIRFLDVLVADGHVMNFQIVNPKTGKSCRPTLIAWQDMRTQLILGFELMVTENTMSVASSFRNACLNAGRLLGVDGAALPRSLYLDNGKAFKNRFFNDKTDLQTQVGGLFERLKPFGLEHVQYARPYNSQTKIIERSWADFEELEQMAVSYVGDCIDNKPASLKRNELWHRGERKKAIAQSGMPTLWGAYKVVEWWISECNNRIRTGRYLPGVSPMMLAAEQMQMLEIGGRTLEGRAMDCMIMNSKTAKLKRNGFNVNGTWYYNHIFMTLVGGSEEYLLKYDILASERILVFHEDGTFLCEAKVSPFQDVHAMAALGSDADRSKLRHVAGQQRALERAVVDAATGRSDRIVAALSEAITAPELPPAADMQLVADSCKSEPEIRLF